MKLIKPPNIIKNFYKKAIWSVPNEKNEIYLTIDDCADEEITIEILDILNRYNIKATFFCIGKYLEINKLHLKMIEDGHVVGNHGYEHLNGLKTDFEKYISNVYRCSEIIDSHLFRPPYGKISRKQYNSLQKSYKIVFWDVLSYDFDENVSPIECYDNVVSNFSSGSIIVFHSNKKSKRNLLYALPNFLEHALKNGYSFSTL